MLLGLFIGIGFVVAGLSWKHQRNVERRRMLAERRRMLQTLLVVKPPPIPAPLPPAHSSRIPVVGTGMDREILAAADLGPSEAYSPPPQPVAPIPARVWEHLDRLKEVVTATRPPQVNKLKWVSPGTPVEIAGRTIPGMVYVSDVPLGWGCEPSAICRSLAVAKTATSMEDLPYFPNYESINPNQRATYLDWLARGRRDEDPTLIPTGYLFLFFYGIERRVLWDGDRDPALWNAVSGMFLTYGLTRKGSSVASYFGDFLHYTAYAMGPELYAGVCLPLLEAHGKRLSETARTLALANHVRMESPMDWNLAHLVAMNLEESRRSVVTERTGDAFKSMFQKRFEDTYPTGFILKTSKRNQRVHYRCGNSTLVSGPQMSTPRTSGVWPPGFVTEVPWVMAIPSQFKKLSTIWNQCIEDLSGYSRAVSRLASSKSVSNQDRMAAYLAIPLAIRQGHRHPLTDEFDQVLQACPEIDGIRFVPVSVLANLLGFAERANLTITQCDEVTVALESLGFTLAPHPGLLNFSLAWSQEVGVARCTALPVDESKLGGVLRLLLLAVLVASADGEADENELQVFHRASEMQDEFSRIQIAVTEAALLRDTQVAARLLPKIAKSVPRLERMSVFKLLVHIAGCDDVISSDENRLLRKIAKAFELGDNALDDVLTDDAAFQTITVARGRAGSRGEAIPQRPAATAVPAFSLDMERIAALTKETAEVVSILSKALAEEGEPDERVVAPTLEAAPDVLTPICPEWAETLDSRYQAALVEIIALPMDGPLNLAVVSKRHHLMQEDLVDGLNAWSDEFLGDFLIEDAGDDGITLRRDLIPSN